MIKLPSEYSSWWKCVEDVLKTCWRRLQHNSFSSSKTSWRRFQHALVAEKMLHFLMAKTENRLGMSFTVRNVSKYGVFSGPYFSVYRKIRTSINFLFSCNDCVFVMIYITITLTPKSFIYICMTHCTKKNNFPIISSLNMTKSAGKCVFGNIY